MEAPIYRLEKIVRTSAEEPEDFVGPLDLILHLLSKNKLEIRDIQLSLILDQYLEWMERRNQLDLEVAGEFVAMAAHLIYIKTRMLLSIHDEEALSEMEELIASLEEHRLHECYGRIKTVAGELAARYASGRDYLPKEPEPLQEEKAYRRVHNKNDLRRAMALLLERLGNKLPPPIAAFQGVVGREPYPVAEKAGELLRRLYRLGVVRFQLLLQGSRSRSEIVAAFIAVLELCKARRVRLAGTDADCTVTCTGEGEQALEELTAEGECHGTEGNGSRY